MASNTLFSFRQSRKLALETANLLIPGNAVTGGTWNTVTIESESANGSGFSRTAFTTLKIAVLAPIPSVRTASAENVKPRFLPRTRKAWIIGLSISVIPTFIDGWTVHARDQRQKIECSIA